METSNYIITTPAELEQSITRAVESFTSNLKLFSLSTPKEVLTLKETSIFLGLSTSTLYTYISKRTVPFVKKNGTIWFLCIFRGKFTSDSGRKVTSFSG